MKTKLEIERRFPYRLTFPEQTQQASFALTAVLGIQVIVVLVLVYSSCLSHAP